MVNIRRNSFTIKTSAYYADVYFELTGTFGLV
jgi:hypothetical protein